MTNDDEPLYARLLAELNHAQRARGRDEMVIALRGVMQLHRPVTYWRPWADEPPSCDQERGFWPCETIRAVAQALGVALDAPVIDVLVSDASHTDTSTKTRE